MIQDIEVFHRRSFSLSKPFIFEEFPVACGLFVGLITLDCVYQVERVPASDEKQVALDWLLAAGGPATNAAIAFRHLGNQAKLLGALGCHPVTSLIQADLAEHRVEMHDLLPNFPAPPPLSTILVTAATGERAVVSRNAVDHQGDPAALSPDCLEGVDVVLLDGHQMAVGWQIARWAVAQKIPVVVDAGSWKPGFDQVCALATCVIAAAKFRLPGCNHPSETLRQLVRMGIPEVAMTQGNQPIHYIAAGQSGTLAVPQVAVKDTLGAGDFFHGAFCHYRLTQSFEAALLQAAAIASLSCQFLGTRAWLKEIAPQG